MFKCVTPRFIVFGLLACVGFAARSTETAWSAAISAQASRNVDAAALARQSDALARRIVRDVGVTGMAVSLVYRGEVVL